MAKVNGTKSAETKTETKTIFAEGISVFNPHEKAPEFVIANVKININKLNDWCVANEDKLTDYKGDAQLNLVIKEGKDGKKYASVDTYGTDFAKESTK